MKVRYWQVALTACLTGVPEILAKLGPNIWKTIPSTPLLLRTLLSVGKAAHRALLRIHRDAYEERKAFLEELKACIALRASPTGTEQDVALKSINRQLNDATMFSRIRRAVKPVSQSALTKR
jgi:hypothetical protein